MARNQYSVHFLPDDKKTIVAKHTLLRDAALDAGVLLPSTCAGLGVCGACKVYVRQGAQTASPTEEIVLGNADCNKGGRLACRTPVLENMLCTIPESSSNEIATIQVHGRQPDCTFLPSAAVVPFSTADLNPAHARDALEQLANYCAAFDQSITETSLSALQSLAAACQKPQTHCWAFINHQKLIAIIEAPKNAEFYAAGIDIGTTTIAAQLLSLTTGEIAASRSTVNAQRAYGGDVVSRIRYCDQHPGGTAKLHRIIIRHLNALLSELAQQVHSMPSAIVKVLLTGNPAMQHLACNLHPGTLGRTPFTPVIRRPVSMPATELKLQISPDGQVETVPHLAGFVGGDITSVLTVIDLEKDDKLNLVIDLGTNGEIVLGNRDRLICCSAPAGPAWEGGCLSWGMPAGHGAIERVRLDEKDIQFQTIGKSAPIGLCGSGLIELLAACIKAGLVDASGRIAEPAHFVSPIPDKLRNRIVVKNGRPVAIRIAEINAQYRWIELTQDDIREVQLAKAAVAAGIAILLKEWNTTADNIAHVYIAGAFGSHLDAEEVAVIGLLPQAVAQKMQFIGNAALTGTMTQLKNRDFQQQAHDRAEQIRYIEVAQRMDFQEFFVEALAFPEPVS